jgi:hypothetical protein
VIYFPPAKSRAEHDGRYWFILLDTIFLAYRSTSAGKTDDDIADYM